MTPRLHGSGPVVMVDDDDVDIELMRRCHGKSDLTNAFLSFLGGDPFLDHMQTVKGGDAEMPAIVMLDINMPMKNGFEVLAELRADGHFMELPVVLFLSNSDNPRDLERCRDLEAAFQEKFVRTADAVDFLNSLAPDA